MIEQELNILIIEDSHTDAELVVHRLSKNDFRFDYHLVESAQEINQILEHHSIDLVISDFNLPGFDGFETLRIVKNYNSMTPFILLSGTISQKQEITALQLGANEVMLKSNLGRLPFSVRRLMYEHKNKKRLKLLESVVTNTKDAVMILEAEARDLPGREIVYVNNAFNQMTGYSENDVIGKTTNILNGPNTDKKLLQQLGDAMDRWEPFEVDLINYKKSGDEFWVNVFVTPVPNQSGGYSHWICIERDITERKNREHKIRQALEEKEVLLAEIHHRVKNNLAVVSSIIQLERMRVDNEQADLILMNSESRILTIAKIHEILYETNNFAEVNLKLYVQNLVDSLGATYDIDRREIEIELQITDLTLNVNQALPVGLIVNELIINAIKHAFSSKNGKKVVVRAIDQTGNKIMFEVSDNGRGLDITPEELEEKGGMGFTLINTLKKQLRADLEIESNNGTSFKFVFEKNKNKGSVNAL